MPRKMCNWRLIEACSRVDVDGIDHIVRVFSSIGGMGCFVLSSRSEQQAPIRSKCQPPEK